MRSLFPILLLAVAVASSQTGSQRSFQLHQSTVAWTPVELPGVPAGLTQRVLHDHKEKSLVSAVVKFPKGFTEPAHFHTKCGHSIYILKGKLRAPAGDLTPGAFTYAAVGEVHGPFTALQETEILFYTDGPFDYNLAEKKQ